MVTRNNLNLETSLDIKRVKKVIITHCSSVFFRTLKIKYKGKKLMRTKKREELCRLCRIHWVI